MTRLIPLASVLVLAACGMPLWNPPRVAPESLFQEPSSVGRIDEIRASHSGCYGTCPIKYYEFHNDGRASYCGRRFVSRLGSYEATIDTLEFQRLTALMRESGFFRLRQN
jgi:hypothetical protein